MSCGVDSDRFRHGLDPALLWLWCRLVAVALIRPLDRELPDVAGMALKSKKRKEKQKKKLYHPEITTVDILLSIYCHTHLI